MPTMNISLTDEFAEFVAKEVAGGDYASASEMVRDALRMMRRDRELDAYKLEVLRRHLEMGVAEAEAGEYSNRTVMQIAASVLDENE